MPRHAIYYVPQHDSPLWSFGSAAIGYDSTRGKDVAFPDHPAFRDREVRAWTEEPRRYGFHGTLKAPFELRTDADEAALISLARKFASRRKAFSIPALQVQTIGRFIALMPTTSIPALDKLAGDCVTEFDCLRASLSPQDRDRRLKTPLTPRQIEYLDRWGYPYVLEEFRFHMTLTGSLNDGPRAKMRDALTEVYESIDAPLVIDAISVCRQDARDGRFVVVERFPFRA
jgi:putative phosphonate metabolism protein